MLKTHILPKFGNQHLDKITTQSIIDFIHGMRDKGYAKGTCNRAIALIKFLYNSALNKFNIPGIESNPALGIERQKGLRKTE